VSNQLSHICSNTRHSESPSTSDSPVSYTKITRAMVTLSGGKDDARWERTCASQQTPGRR